LGSLIASTDLTASISGAFSATLEEVEV